MPKAADFSAWMGARQARIESVLTVAFEAQGAFPVRLHEAMRYSVLDGGKRVRPLLAYAAGEAAGGDLDAVDQAAAAVEVIHAYSLVHDDMPCMDNDAMRRGKPTCHVAYDEATALLVGDALQSMAFGLLAQARVALPARLELVTTLAAAAGSQGMAGGQAIDLESTGLSLEQTALETMHAMKTGALIRAAVRMGALCAGASAWALESLDHFARRAGLLFQVVDDVLDYTATSAQFGKTAGKDAQQGKVTFVSLMGATGAGKYIQQLESEATAALKDWGQEADRLRQLCRFIAQRSY